MADGNGGYDLHGTLLEACSCGVLCPCWIGEDPDGDGTCDAFNAYHFDRGTIGGIDVSGMNYIRVVKIPGNVLDPQSWTQVVFVDDRASEEQAQALVGAYEGNYGGALADLAGLDQGNPRGGAGRDPARADRWRRHVAGRRGSRVLRDAPV